MSDQQQQGTETPAAESVADQQADDRVGGEVANEEINVGSQGEQVPADAVGADQSRPVAQSAPPPSAQSGVPLSEEREAGVEAQPEYAGPVGTASGSTPAVEQPEAGEGAGTTHPASPSE